ncbi:Pectinesterase 2-like protein [Drosera capensis]
MVTKVALVFLSIIFASSLNIQSSLADYTLTGIDEWCHQTPYPDACKYHFASRGLAKQISDFKKMSFQIARDTALAAHAHAQGLGPHCRNENERAAWDDCVSLYEDTVLQLNKTLSTTGSCTSFDQQTWLSAALTNLETCNAGFVDFGVTGYVLSLLSNNNVSQLISNSLALNGNASTQGNKATYEDGFPAWVMRHDRKLLQSTAASSANLVVAQDGSGDYKTISAALAAAASRKGSGRFVIHVASGVYSENIATKLTNIMLVGDGMSSTIITGSKSVVGGSTTFGSATFAVTGGGFIAQGITFRNTAGPANHQAVAMRSGSDLSVFYQCGFEGYQDTLYTYAQRQFYKDCNIYGTVDFIFGNAAVVFQGCNMYVRKPLASQQNTVTAQGRTDPNQNTGTVIQDCTITAASDLKPVVSSFNTYLGRPWQEYSRTVVMETYLDSLINAAGWLAWDGTFALSTLYYAEYANTGPGSSTSGRVKWAGYRVITSSTAAQFSVANFIAGSSWLPATNVPFTAGL